jgi:hypothetical protein
MVKRLFPSVLQSRGRALRLCLVLAGLPLLAAAQNVAMKNIAFEDFASDKGLTLNGAAKVTGADGKPAKALRVTPSEELQAGSAYFSEKVALKQGFETTFTFQINDRKGDGVEEKLAGADGFAFIIQNSGAKAIGDSGSGLGYATSDNEGEGIKNSLAIEFDVFDYESLGADEDPFHDPNGNHISVHSAGPEPNHADEAYSLGKVSEGLPDFKDGKSHTVKITYVPGTLKVYMDKEKKPALTVAVDLGKFSGKGFKDASVLDAEGKAWVGFTGGTGGMTESHDILSWKLTPGAPDTKETKD